MDVILRNLPHMMRGLELTIILSLASLAGSLVGGTFLALLRMSPSWWLRWPAIIYIDVVRMIPLIMVIFWVFFLLPLVTDQPFTPIVAVLVALIGFNSSYMAEVIRAGIQTVPTGLVEAARCSGLNHVQTTARIVLPIAFKNMLPALVNRFVALVLGTSLAYVIGATEFFRAANDINNRVFRPYEIYTFVALVYFVLCFGLSLLGRSLERRLSRGQRLITDHSTINQSIARA